MILVRKGEPDNRLAIDRFVWMIENLSEDDADVVVEVHNHFARICVGDLQWMGPENGVAEHKQWLTVYGGSFEGAVNIALDDNDMEAIANAATARTERINAKREAAKREREAERARSLAAKDMDVLNLLRRSYAEKMAEQQG